MRRRIWLIICCIFLTSCLLPLISFGNNGTEVKLSVHKVTINCDENGSFMVDETTFNNVHNFFVGNAGSIMINITPNIGYQIGKVTYSSSCDVIFENDKLIISNIYDDININIEFKETSIFKENPELIPIPIPEAGTTVNPTPEDSENNIIQDTESELVENTDKSGKLEKEKRYKCCCFWWIILVILILIIIVIKVKKKMEDK